jgi:tRNA A-37 threonylcarbamoyl transferase component Bud32|tara:strand:+ start:1929 stop:2591 length:663 start_codon:yes stop_codon:yes gene_type:complete
MKRWSKRELHRFVQENQVLLGTLERPALMLTQEQQVVKFFYRRKFISTSLLIPQAKRFRSNSIKLKQLGITAPDVSELIYCPDIPVHMAVYEYLKGDDFRVLCSRNDYQCIDRLPSYIALLHERGVYFRAIHLGNVLQLDEDELALVDITDLSVRRKLTIFQRARNIAHLFNSVEDKLLFANYGIRRFLDAYYGSVNLTNGDIRWLEWRLKMSLSADLIS